ncbi:hypothetical protein BH09VER1_BH09VER1_24510 [soil metagenome]
MDSIKIHIGSDADVSGFKEAEAASNELGAAVTKVGGLSQDAAGRWKSSAGQFATSAQIAAAGVEQLGQKAAAATRQASDGFKNATHESDEFINSIKMGIGIDIGGRLVNTIGAIPGMFKDAISKGVEFNITMDNASVGIQNVLAKFMNLDQVAAKREAAAAMQQIIDLEPKAAGGLADLTQGFMATVATAQGVGISVKQNIDLVGRFANALSNANVPIQQIGQEMRSILSGNITADSSIAKILSISNEDIAKAREAGTLYQFLVDKIGKIGEAGDSASVRLSSFDSAIQKALGAITKPIFDVFIDGVNDLAESVNKGGGDLNKLGFEIAELVRQGVGFTKWSIENSGALITMAKAVGGLVAAYAAFKITSIIQGLAGKARALLSSKVAIDAETASLARNTAGQEANAIATAAAGAARSSGAAGGLLSRVSGAAGNVASKLGGTAIIGAGLIGFDAAMSYAASVNEKSAKTDDLGNKVTDVAGKYNDLIKAAGSVAEKQEIIKGLETDIAVLKKLAVSASAEDSEMMLRGIGILEKKLETAKKLSEEKLREKEATTTAAAAEKAAQEQAAADAEKNKSILAAHDARQHEKARDDTASIKLDEARGLMDKGDGAGAKKSLDDQEQYFRDWLSKAKADQGGKVGDGLKQNLDLQDKLQGYLDKIAEARKDLPKALAEADENSKKKQIEGLEEQKQLLEAQGKERIAQAGKDQAAKLKIEDEIAKKRLEYENEIGALRGESSLKAEARAAEFRAGEILRENALAEAAKQNASAVEGTKPGELFAGTNRRRGAITSDTFEQDSGVGVGQAARPLTNFRSLLTPGTNDFGTNATNLVPPPAAPGAPAASAPGAAASSGQAGGQAITSAADKAADAAKEIEQATTEGLGKIGSALSGVVGGLRKKYSELDSRVKALEDGV